MTSEEARAFTCALTLYETRLRLTTRKGATVEGVVEQIGLFNFGKFGLSEGVRLAGIHQWFNLRECKPLILDQVGERDE